MLRKNSTWIKAEDNKEDSTQKLFIDLSPARKDFNFEKLEEDCKDEYLDDVPDIESLANDESPADRLASTLIPMTKEQRIKSEIDRILNETAWVESNLDDSIEEIEDNWSELTLKSGYLMKKGTSLFVGWQKRYFTLSNKRLCYFREERDLIPSGSFNFEKIWAYIIVSPDDRVCFSMFIEGIKREFKLKAESAQQRDEWTRAINQHIEAAKKTMSKDVSLIKEKNFWKKWEKITTEKFAEEADSGDILLFKGKKLGSKITRGITNSEFDHIGMVLKFEDDEEVYMLDATLAGVNITSWRQLWSYKDKLYSKIVWRKLYIKRNDEFIERLSIFVKAVHKKKYSLKISKLLTR